MAENNIDSVAEFIALAGEITIAWLQNTNVHAGGQDVPAFLKSVHTAIAELTTQAPVELEASSYEPAAPIRSSVKPGYLVSLIDGKKYRTLKRHLSAHGLTPDEYRARYGLKSDYPMVAAEFATLRRDIASRIRRGRKETAPEETGLKDAGPKAAAPQRSHGASEVKKQGAAAKKAPGKGRATATSPRGPSKAKSAVPVASGEAPAVVIAPVKEEAAASANPKQAVRKAVATKPVAEPVAKATPPADGQTARKQPAEALVKTRRAASPKKAVAKGAPLAKAGSAKAAAKELAAVVPETAASEG
ncbi:MucR family transcriptional regulator [Novosphingobium sp.]|uniref:MucR family transcriptional regulator n=1 Tax=Novosphingobium sp. TaxID=1874826 RepID=UPI0031DAD6C4